MLDLPELHAKVDYEPGESMTGLFGGNSNWRGPISALAPRGTAVLGSCFAAALFTVAVLAGLAAAATDHAVTSFRGRHVPGSGSGQSTAGMRSTKRCSSS